MSDALSATLQGLRVLIAEDDTLLAKLLARQIEGLGLTMIGVASDGEEAVALADSFAPDLLLLDLGLPKKHGLQAAREILSRRFIPVIAITGQVRGDLVEQAAGLGVFAYLASRSRSTRSRPPSPSPLPNIPGSSSFRLKQLRTRMLSLGILPKLALSLAALVVLPTVGVWLATGHRPSAVALLAWGLGMGLLLLVVRSHLVLPLRSLIRAVEALQGRNDSAPIKKVTLDETGRLAAAFEGMRREIYLAVERAERAGQEWQATFDTIRDQVFLLGPDFTIRRANRAAVEAWGRPPRRSGGSALPGGLQVRKAVCVGEVSGRESDLPALPGSLRRAP